MGQSAAVAVTGNKGIYAKLTGPGAVAGVEFDDEIKKVEILTEDKDDSDLTFYEAAQGLTKDFKVGVTALYSMTAGSLWRILWDNPGAEYAFVYGPYGNALPSAAQPHFVMTIKATGKPPAPQEARIAKDRENFEYEFEVTVDPVLDSGV